MPVLILIEVNGDFALFVWCRKFVKKIVFVLIWYHEGRPSSYIRFLVISIEINVV